MFVKVYSYEEIRTDMTLEDIWKALASGIEKMTVLLKFTDTVYDT